MTPPNRQKRTWDLPIATGVGLVMNFQRPAKDFAGGTADDNLPANTGDTGSILSPGRFHTPGIN